MPSRLLREYLDGKAIKYVSIWHSPAFTAQEIAERAHVSGELFAKTVIVEVDGELAMAVLPASHYLELARLAEALGAGSVELAAEAQFADRFPDCGPGAMPPFGNLYGLRVFVSDTLAGRREIAFNAGTHWEVIELAYRDFARLVKPEVHSLSAHRREAGGARRAAEWGSEELRGRPRAGETPPSTWDDEC